MFLNLYKLNFQKKKSLCQWSIYQAMSALYCYHSKIMFHKSMSYSSDSQKPLNSFKCLHQLWLMVNEACTKKSFYMTMCKFSEVCIYITVFYSLTFKSVWSTTSPNRQLCPLSLFCLWAALFDHKLNTFQTIKWVLTDRQRFEMLRLTLLCHRFSSWGSNISSLSVIA